MQNTTMKILLLIPILGLFTGCTVFTNSNDKSEQKAENEQLEAFEPKMPSHIDAWGEDELGNVQFVFDEDSIFYPDSFVKYKYEKVKDTLKIHTGSHLDYWVIKGISKDSLTIEYLDYEMVISYARRN